MWLTQYKGDTVLCWTQYCSYILHFCQEHGSFLSTVAKTDDWPISKDMLIKKHYKAFAKFTKKLDKIKEINT